MVLTKSELISALQHECRILVHLASKVDRSQLDYRLTSKQRSTLEWFQYMSMMGANIVAAVKAGAFNPEAWQKDDAIAKSRDLDQTVAAIQALGKVYEKEIGAMTDDELRQEVTMFGVPGSKGATLVRIVLGGHAAYRTQIFNYLKACGAVELSTMNLWAGMDAPAA
jgi:hypothetical protein